MKKSKVTLANAATSSNLKENEVSKDVAKFRIFGTNLAVSPRVATAAVKAPKMAEVQK